MIRTKYVGFHWKRNVPPGELSPAAVELTSESEPIDNCLRFHAVGLVDDERAGAVGCIFRTEARWGPLREAERARVAQAAL